MTADRRYRRYPDGCIFAPRRIDLPRALNGERRVSAAAEA
jgi:hypothetical protein